MINNTNFQTFGSIHKKTLDGQNQRISEKPFEKSLRTTFKTAPTNIGLIDSKKQLPTCNADAVNIFFVRDIQQGKPDAVKIILPGEQQAVHLLTGDSPISKNLIASLKQLMKQAAASIN